MYNNIYVLCQRQIFPLICSVSMLTHTHSPPVGLSMKALTNETDIPTYSQLDQKILPGVLRWSNVLYHPWNAGADKIKISPRQHIVYQSYIKSWRSVLPHRRNSCGDTDPDPSLCFSNTFEVPFLIPTVIRQVSTVSVCKNQFQTL